MGANHQVHSVCRFEVSYAALPQCIRSKKVYLKSEMAPAATALLFNKSGTRNKNSELNFKIWKPYL